jgi:hypothetical protein
MSSVYDSRRITSKLVCLAAFTSGCLAGVLHPMADFDYTPEIGRATAQFDVPAGWRTLPFGAMAPSQVTLIRVASGDKQHEIVATINFYHIHSFQKDKTQQGCAEDYLDGVRRHADSHVEMDLVSTFQSPRNGVLNIYRFHSAYWRERWAVFIIKGDYEVQIEISAHDFAETVGFPIYLQELAQDISITSLGKR